MNQEQLLSLLRTFLQMAGTFVLGHGVFGANTSQWWELITGVIIMVVPTIWSMYAHTDHALIANVTAMPDVKKIIVAPGATDGVGAAAADPAQPKVVTQ
jgi:hypothetical protein